MSDLPTLSDGDTTLRPWEAADAADLHRQIQDREIARWLDIAQPYTLEDAERFVTAAAERWARREAAHLVIGDPDGRFLGYLGVLSVEDEMRVVELVYWVAASARGRGIATRALRLVLPWIRSELEPDRIELGMVDGNAASAAVAEANGFVLREIVPGAATLDGHPADERIYQLS